jgi:energy-coupling factor transport system ATP-binding protein
MSRLVVIERGRIVYDGTPEDVFKNDLEELGVFMPPLVRFCHKFGFPYAGKVAEIDTRGEWNAEIKDRPVRRGGLAASVLDVYYRYPGAGADMLKGVSIDVYRGEVLAIMGANGSGKTTLVKHFNGLIRPRRGKVLLRDRDIAGRTVAENARAVGFVCQNVNHQLFEETVLRELTFGPVNLGFPPEAAAAMARKAAESLGLGEKFLVLSPFSLSGGEKQRVAIASALAPGPDVLVLDEPTLGLNQGLKLKLAGALAKIKEDDKAVVLVTHDVEFVAAFADRIVIMSDGKVLADGAAREILASDIPSGAALHPPQATEIGKKLGVDRVLAVEELARRGTGGQPV